MPTIKVNEKDLSWYSPRRDPADLTVLVPVLSTFGPVDEPTLVTSDTLSRVFGGPVSCRDDFSFTSCESFVKEGADALVWRVNPYSDETQCVASGNLSTKVAYDLTTSEPDDWATHYTDYYTLTGTEYIKVPKSAQAPSWTSSTYYSVVHCNDIQVSAKYPGSFGNQIKVFLTTAEGLHRYYVKVGAAGVTVETGLVHFTDPSNQYYFLTLESSYVNFALEDIDFEDTHPELSATASVTLTGGSDFDSVTDYTLTTSEPSDWSTEYTSYFTRSGSEGSYVYTAVSGASAPSWSVDTYYSSSVPSIKDLAVRKIKGSGVSTVLDNLEDVLMHSFDTVFDGGFNDVESLSSEVSSIDKKFTKLCKSRGDSIYLVGGCKDMTTEDFYSYCGLPSETSEVSAEGFDTSYAVAYGPWCNAVLTSTGSVGVLPGTYAFLISWAQSLSKGTPKWLAPAGVKRSSLGGIVKSTVQPVGSSVLDLWQNHDDVEVSSVREYKVNPITNLKNYGYVVYGNSTLLKSQADGSTSMLQSVSTRVVANMIKTRAYEISLGLQFDQISSDLFLEFKTTLSVFMDQLKYGGALYDYQIVADRASMTLDALNSRTVPVRIRISPTPAAENFVINLEISQAGVTFEEDSADAES